jgi:hypothetical protein
MDLFGLSVWGSFLYSRLRTVGRRGDLIVSVYNQFRKCLGDRCQQAPLINNNIIIIIINSSNNKNSSSSKNNNSTTNFSSFLNY